MITPWEITKCSKIPQIRLAKTKIGKTTQRYCTLKLNYYKRFIIQLVYCTGLHFFFISECVEMLVPMNLDGKYIFTPVFCCKLPEFRVSRLHIQGSPNQAVTGKIYRLQHHSLPPKTA